MSRKNSKNILLDKLENIVKTDNEFYFVKSLKNSGEPLYIAKDDGVLHLVQIKIYTNSYSVKYSVKDNNSIINIEQKFINNPEKTAKFINNKISEISKKIGQD